MTPDRYRAAERRGGAIFVAAGLTAVSLCAWLAARATAYRGMIPPLGVLGLVEIGIGATVFLRTPHPVDARRDRDRMRGVIASFRVYKVVEVLHYAPRQSNRRETLLGIALVKFEVSLDEGIEQGPRIKLEHTLLNKNLAERLFLIQDPRMNRPDQLVSADEVHLQREAAEQEIAIDV